MTASLYMDNFHLLETSAYHMPIGEAAIVAVVSVCTVMAILFIISSVLNLFNIFYAKNLKAEEAKKVEELSRINAAKKIEEEKAQQALKEDVAAESESENIDLPDEKDTMDDLCLVAVITAAVAASTGTATDRIVVHSIRRTSAWKNMALASKANK